MTKEEALQEWRESVDRILDPGYSELMDGAREYRIMEAYEIFRERMGQPPSDEWVAIQAELQLLQFPHEQGEFEKIVNKVELPDEFKGSSPTA